MNGGQAPTVIRCVVCGEPANTLTDDAPFCNAHAAERRLDGGGWAQFALRQRILRPEPPSSWGSIRNRRRQRG